MQIKTYFLADTKLSAPGGFLGAAAAAAAAGGSLGDMGGMPAAAAAAAAQAAAAGLFPPGLEALYRQAGFPPFLGLGPGGLNRSGSSEGSGGSGGSLPPSSSAGGNGGGMASPPPPPPISHGGLQSHASNPTSKSRKFHIRGHIKGPCDRRRGPTHCGKQLMRTLIMY